MSAEDPWDSFPGEVWDIRFTPNIRSIRAEDPFSGMIMERQIYLEGRNCSIETAQAYFPDLLLTCPTCKDGEIIIIRSIQVDPSKRHQGLFKSFLSVIKGIFKMIIFEFVMNKPLLSKLIEGYNFKKVEKGFSDLSGNPSVFWIKDDV
jgi:hypothetical protein